MKNKTMKEMASLIIYRWGEEKSEKIMKNANYRLNILCCENADSPKAVKRHTYNNIFPCISLYEALQKYGISKKEALTFLDESWSIRAKKDADIIKNILKIPGVYKLYPFMYQWVANNQYGIDAGFKAVVYNCEKQRCKFDITKCLFFDTCQKYGCPELTQCFCHTDDVINFNLHPKLIWNRTQFMGKGDKLCDFDIEVRKREK